MIEEKIWKDKSYLDNLENRICVKNYLVDAKGISIKELNDYRIRQEQKNSLFTHLLGNVSCLVAQDCWQISC